MPATSSAPLIQLIPISQIDILNSRERNIKVFEDIVASIRAVGLKKPITVTPRPDTDGERYLLVCGEGRIKAFKVLGEDAIPARIVQVSEEDAFVMGLVENIARRFMHPLELLSSIRDLQDKGYDKKQIAVKVGMSPERVQGILILLSQGEESLLRAVEKGVIPLTVALTIAGHADSDKHIQTVLQELYESGALRGRELDLAKRIATRREQAIVNAGQDSHPKPSLTANQLVRTYQREVDRQKSMIRRSRAAQEQLLFAVTAMRTLLADNTFVDILRAEGLDSLPAYLAEKVLERSIA